MSRGFSSNGKSDDSIRPATPASSNLSRTERFDLLNRVIDQTTTAGNFDKAGELRQRLLEVAQRHPQVPLSLDPIVVELVRAALAEKFPGSTRGAETWDDMITSVARTLFEDSSARDRLNSLWAQLSEVGHG